ncbi:MAG: hypothetical protein RIT45_1061 [Pseudomonadota bacterium]|jgi:pseudouridine-5'-phosphate glycosidase
MIAEPSAILVSPAVRAALAEGRGVVALESTILAHGFPAGEGRALADALQDAVRAAGAEPATIAICGGQLCVGLDAARLDALLDGRKVRKCGARELAWCAAAGDWGATTVSGTMALAAAAGVRVFATGGIGGVHRGHGELHDVSADLDALARFPVLVVAAGAKSLLDLPRTLEALETRGVPVVGFGTDAFPSFYCRESGLRVGLRVDTPAQAARAFALQARIGAAGGALLCNPPPEDAALPRAEVDAWVDAGLRDAEAAGVRGAAVTPFVLARLLAISGGRTLRTNRALALSNATVAGRVAAALAEHERSA